METYLGDTLRLGVENDDAVLRRLIGKVRELRDLRFSLEEISLDPDLVRNQVMQHLSGIVYHNLAKTDVLYQAAFGLKIMTGDEITKKVSRAVALRHDCVHRNGMGKDGKPHKVFTPGFVTDISDRIREFVERIEVRVNPA